MVSLRLCLAVVLVVVNSRQSDARDVHIRSDDPAPLEDVVMKQGQLISQMQAKISALEAKSATTRLVAFMVSVPQSESLTTDRRIRYGTPDLNVGGGFHTNTDTFVAPVPGLYVFFLKVSAGSGEVTHYGIFALKKEDKVIAETETNDDDNIDRSSVQVIVQLAEGDTVWVEKTGGGATTIYGGGVHSTLGGFLLAPGDSF